MAKIKCKYFTTVLSIAKKNEEIFDIIEGITVDNFLKILVKKYGDDFRRNVFSEGILNGKHFSTPNIYLNKKRQT